MAEALKREVSLTLLSVRLVDAKPDSPPPTADGKTLTPTQHISCELQVTGNAKDRGLVDPAIDAIERAPRRRRPNVSMEAVTAGASQPELRTLARWILPPREVQLPVQYDAAAGFREKPPTGIGWLANAARTAVYAVPLLSEARADMLERFAAATAWLPSGRPTLPSSMLRQLETLLPTVMGPGDSLWLEIAEPSGYLPLLPWEEMLRPVTPAPVLRLSPHAVQALSIEQKVVVALIVCAPSEGWVPTPAQLAALGRGIVDGLPKGSPVHVFCDDLCHGPFGEALPLIGDARAARIVKLHPLPPAPTQPGADEGDWRNWIAESLNGSAVDIVHCIAPGRLYADHARLVMPYAPRLNPNWKQETFSGAFAGIRPMRYVTALEICEALTALGAWGAIVSAPPRGRLLAEARNGLRLLVDQIARLRPGVAAFHDFEMDPRCAALADTYRFIIGDPSIRASRSAAVSVYCHPARAAHVASEPTQAYRDLMDRYAKVKLVMQEAMSRSDPTPAWVAATQRILEREVSRVTSDPLGPGGEAAARGLTEALEYVEQMVGTSASSRAADEGRHQGGNVNG